MFVYFRVCDLREYVIKNLQVLLFIEIRKYSKLSQNYVEITEPTVIGKRKKETIYNLERNCFSKTVRVYWLFNILLSI